MRFLNIPFFDVGIKSGSPSSSNSPGAVNGLADCPFFESLRYNSSLPEPRRADPNSRLYDFSISTPLMGCRIRWMMNAISDTRPRRIADPQPIMIAIVVFSKSRTLAAIKEDASQTMGNINIKNESIFQSRTYVRQICAVE